MDITPVGGVRAERRRQIVPLPADELNPGDTEVTSGDRLEACCCCCCCDTGGDGY